MIKKDLEILTKFTLELVSDEIVVEPKLTIAQRLQMINETTMSLRTTKETDLDVIEKLK